MPATIPRLVVEIFDQPEYQGRNTVILEPVRFTGDIGFQDNIGSVKVYKGPGFASGPSYKAILYEHINFTGRKLALGPGWYPDLATAGYSFSDTVSSIGFGPDLSLSGPDWGMIPVIIEAYREPHFQGERVTILRDNAFTQNIGLQDAIRSFRIVKGPNFPPTGCKVIFYEHIDFQGAAMPIQVTARDAVIEAPDLGLLPERWSGQISSVRIEGWTQSQEFVVMVFHDEFSQERMHGAWRWEDPRGFGQWSAFQGYLQMNVASGVDLWHGLNFDAPRLVQNVHGDFAIETRMPVTSQLREHGGLLVWKDSNAFLRLEKTSGPHAFRGDVRFERHYPRGYELAGRGAGLGNVKQLYLRMERRGNAFSGYASEDGIHWLYCGQTVSVIRDPVAVGLHALTPGNIPPTVTRFDYFRIFRRRRDAAVYRGPMEGAPRGRRQLQALTAVRGVSR
jgi:hypothetical protein